MIYDWFGLNNRKILVTGASGSIGRQIAIKLSECGANLVLTGRNLERLSETYRSLFGEGHKMIKADLTINSEIGNIIDCGLEGGTEKYSGLVHCAGGGKLIPIKILKQEYLEKSMRTNFYPFIEIVRIMSQRKYCTGGSFIALSSYAAKNGEKCQTAYASAKAALDAAVHTLAYELAQKKIRINSIRPGVIESNAELQLGDRIGEAAMHSLLDKQVLGIGQPDDIAYMAAFLLSDMSRMITGKCMDVDGGRL